MKMYPLKKNAFYKKGLCLSSRLIFSELFANHSSYGKHSKIHFTAEVEELGLLLIYYSISDVFIF